MPVVFRDVEPEKITIEKDGTKFFFEVNEGSRKSMQLNFNADPEKDIGKAMLYRFRKCLKGWDTLVDDTGKEIPFSVAVRDALVNGMEVFDETDIYEVLIPDLKKKTETMSQKSISESASEKPSSCAGDLKSVEGATITPAVKKKKASA